jgi:hypothetical protein
VAHSRFSIVIFVMVDRHLHLPPFLYKPSDNKVAALDALSVSTHKDSLVTLPAVTKALRMHIYQKETKNTIHILFSPTR